MVKLLQKEGCKNDKCSAWKGECQRATIYRVGKKLDITMVTKRHNTSPCELYLPRRFPDERSADTK